MSKTSALSIAATAVIVTAVSAHGQALQSATDVFAPYGPFGGWNVFINETRGSCFAELVSETSVLQMGITDPAVFGYIGVFTQAPTDLESGRVESVTLVIGERQFVGEVTEASGNIPGGFSGGYIVSRDAGLLEALAQGTTMSATIGNRETVEIGLGGTAVAIEAMQACNAAQAS